MMVILPRLCYTDFIAKKPISIQRKEVRHMAIDLTKYGITGVSEIVYNPSY